MTIEEKTRNGEAGYEATLNSSIGPTKIDIHKQNKLQCKLGPYSKLKKIQVTSEVKEKGNE